MIQTLRNILVSLVAFLCATPVAWANDAPSMGDEIVAFFDTSPETSVVPLRPAGLMDKSILLIQDVADSVFSSESKNLSAAIEGLVASSASNPESWEKAITFSKGVENTFRTSAATNLKSDLILYFDTFDYGDDWYLQSVSQSLSAFLYISNNQFLIAAERVDNAMQIIPSELSEQATSSRLLASEIAMVLHGLQGNPKFMLDAARLQKQAKAEIGETLNRHEMMTNFLYALNRKRDFESASQVADLLLLEDRPDDVIPGLAEAYIAQTYNELERYGDAKAIAESNLEQFDHSVVIQRSKFALIIALAGLGEESRARRLMVEQGWNQPRETLLTTVDKEAILHAEALLAMHRGESKFALSLMKRRADILISRVQSANSGNMTTLLSNLENTRERQSERENALQREAEMRAVQLEQKTNLNRLLWVLIIGLTIAFNFLLAFLRYREKLNVKVQGLQEDALSSEKMKTEFLGVINHELRTPLNGIIGISDAMIHHATSPMMQEQAKAVQQSGQLLFDLLDSLITMSTIESDRLSLDKEDARLSKTITREVAEWTNDAADKGLAFTHFIGAGLDDAVIADHKRIRQSLRYLLSNAIRFTHTGRVHLHATAAPDSSGNLNVTIVVADTGQGISAETQSRLFKPFLQADATMTRKYGGAGLSLAIARKLARMMDGDLVVKSADGRGSEFTYTAKLPLAQQAPVPVEAPVTVATTSQLADLDTVKEPEDIIDLMLEQQLFSKKPARAQSLSTPASQHRARG